MTFARAAFVFGHVVTAEAASGGDVLALEEAASLVSHDGIDIVAVVPPVGLELAARRLGKEHVAAWSEPAIEPSILLRTSPRLLWRWISRIPRVTAAIRKTRPAVICTSGDFFVDTVPAALNVLRDRSIGWVAMVHHINEPPGRRKNSFIASLASYVLQRFSLAVIALFRATVVVESSGVADQLVSFGYHRERIRILGGAIRVGQFPFVGEIPAGARIAWVNRLTPTKGVEDVPALMARLPGFSLDMVGAAVVASSDDKLRKALRDENLTDRVRIHGYVTHEERVELLRGARAFISCSYEEGWGLSICEALAVGLPVVSYDLEAIVDVFGDHVVRVPVGDVTAFARAVVRAVESDSPERRRSRRAFAEQYDISQLAARLKMVLLESRRLS